MESLAVASCADLICHDCHSSDVETFEVDAISDAAAIRAGAANTDAEDLTLDKHFGVLMEVGLKLLKPQCKLGRLDHE